MKRVNTLLILLILFTGIFVSALDEPAAGVGDEDVEKIQEAIGNYSPLDDSGDVDFDKYKPFKTKADERIAKINKYVGPITKVLFGTELFLSWIFIFSFIVWILLIEIIVMPLSEIFDWNIWLSLLGSGIVASLAMQGLGKNFVIWMESLATQWWIGITVLVGSVIVGIIYSLFIKTIGAKFKTAKEKTAKEKTKRDRKIIHTEAEIAKKSLKNEY